MVLVQPYLGPPHLMKPFWRAKSISSNGRKFLCGCHSLHLAMFPLLWNDEFKGCDMQTAIPKQQSNRVAVAAARSWVHPACQCATRPPGSPPTDPNQAGLPWWVTSSTYPKSSIIGSATLSSSVDAQPRWQSLLRPVPCQRRCKASAFPRVNLQHVDSGIVEVINVMDDFQKIWLNIALGTLALTARCKRC